MIDVADWTLPVGFGAIAAYLFAATSNPKLRAKVRWGVHGRGYPMSASGARAAAVATFCYAIFFAVHTSDLPMLGRVIVWCCGGTLCIALVACLRDREAADSGDGPMLSVDALDQAP